jgi:hypothetical protein
MPSAMPSIVVLTLGGSGMSKFLRFAVWVVLSVLGGFLGWFFGFGLSLWLDVFMAPWWAVEYADTFLIGFGVSAAGYWALGVR